MNVGFRSYVVLSRRVILLQVDIAYVPFIERIQIFYSNIKNYDITKGRPNLQKFIEVIHRQRDIKQAKALCLYFTHNVWYDPFILMTRLHSPMQTSSLDNTFLMRNFKSWIGIFQEVNKIDAYTQTKLDPQFLLEQTKKRLGVWYFLIFSALIDLFVQLISKHLTIILTSRLLKACDQGWNSLQKYQHSRSRLD